MNDKKIAIRIRNLGKHYKLGGPQQQYHTLRNAIVNSVLLKILSRITAPTEETVELRGRVGPLLEVGTGYS